MKTIEYKGLKIKVKKSKQGNCILECKNAMVVCDEPNERSLEKLYKTVVDGSPLVK